MKKVRLIILATVVSAYAIPSFAGTVATVNGKPIDQSEVQTILSMSPNLAKTPHARHQVVQNLINMEILSQYAIKHHINESANFKTRLALAREQILADVAVDHYVHDHPVTASALQSAYHNFVKSMGKKEYKVRQILVKTKADAENILRALKNGKKFKGLAQKDSIIRSGAAHGGELGWIVPAMFSAPLAKAIETAPIEKPFGPVKTQYGYHVMEVQATRAITPPSFNAIKERLKVQLAQREAARFVDDLRHHADIKIFG